MSDIIISGYYGFGNNGDEALLTAIINDIRAVKRDAGIVVLSKTPLQTQKLHNLKSISRTGIFSIISQMKKSRLLISGGGSLIQDATSTKSLFYYLGIITLAKMCGCRVMLYANGIGPVNGKLNRKLVRRVLNGADCITLRESSSLSELAALGVDKPEISVTADPALNFEPCGPARTDEILASVNIKDFLVVSVRSWKKFDKFADELSIAIAAICEKYSLTPLFIPMHHKYDTDISVYCAGKTNGAVLGAEYGTDEILGIMSRACCVVGMRLHSLIYACGAEVPTVGVVYDPKVSAFLDYVNNKNYIDIESFSSDKLAEITENAINSKERNASEIIAVMKEKARENAYIAVRML